MNDDSLEFEKVADGPLNLEQLKTSDVMLVNVGTHILVAVGSEAPYVEKVCRSFKLALCHC